MFVFLFFFPFSFFVFTLLFVVLRVPSSFLFRSFRLFVLSFSVFSCIAFFFAFIFASFSAFLKVWWRILLLCYFVSARHPAHAPCEPEVCKFPLRAVLFLALLMLTCFVFFFYSLPSLFRIRIGHRLCTSVFFLWVLCCLLGFGFCCDLFNILYVSRYILTPIPPLYFCLRYTICYSYCVYYLLFLLRICFPPMVIFRSSYWSLSYDHGLLKLCQKIRLYGNL